jgi:hypothetical protein
MITSQMEVTTSKRKQNIRSFVNYVNRKLSSYFVKSKKDSDLAVMNVICRDKKKVGAGVQGTIYKCQGDQRKDIAVKVTPLTKYQTRLQNKIFSTRALKQEPFIELAAVTLINQLVLQNVCPNFVLNYYYEVVQHCDKKKGRDTGHCTFQYNEFVEGGMTFEKWAETRHKNRVWFNAFFQILAALYAMEKYYNMKHSDLHAQNVLVRKITPGGYWKYVIDGFTYYVPNLGYQFLVNDFGFSWIPKHMEVTWYHKKHLKLNSFQRNVFDIAKMRYILEYTDKSTREVSEAFSSVFDFFIDNPEEFTDLRDVIEMLYTGTFVGQENCNASPHFCYTDPKHVSGSLIQTFSLNKRLRKNKIPKDLHNLLIHSDMFQ